MENPDKLKKIEDIITEISFIVFTLIFIITWTIFIS